MLQRLGIADALVKDPDVLILDEPTTAIDPLGVTEILDLLRSLVEERQMAILLSSHLLNQVQHVCDRIGIFAAGRLIGQGSMSDLAHRFGEDTAHVEAEFQTDNAAGVERVREVLTAIPGVVGVDAPKRAVDAWTITRQAGRRRDPRPALDPRGRGLDRARPHLGPVGRAVARGDLPPRRRASRPRPREGRPMTAGDTPLAPTPAFEPVDAPAEGLPRQRRTRRRPSRPSRPAPGATATAPSRPGASAPCPTPAGWSSAGKEFADHLWSARFVVLLIVLGLAALIPMYFDGRRDPDGGRVAGDRPIVDLPVPVHARPARSATPGSSCRPRGSSSRSSGRCSGSPSRSTRSTASGPAERCRGSCRSRSTATT